MLSPQSESISIRRNSMSLCSTDPHVIVVPVVVDLVVSPRCRIERSLILVIAVCVAARHISAISSKSEYASMDGSLLIVTRGFCFSPHW